MADNEVVHSTVKTAIFGVPQGTVSGLLPVSVYIIRSF